MYFLKISTTKLSIFLVLNHEIPTILKKRILTQYGDLANVNGFELEYIELIVEQRIIIPINFTMKFYDKDIDNEKEKHLYLNSPNIRKRILKPWLII